MGKKCWGRGRWGTTAWVEENGEPLLRTRKMGTTAEYKEDEEPLLRSRKMGNHCLG